MDERIICRVCKDPHHSMSLREREAIIEARNSERPTVTPLLPEEYHSTINRSKAE
jgi:hypothetical protein